MTAIRELETVLLEARPEDGPIVVSRDGKRLDPHDRKNFYRSLFASFRRNDNGDLEVRAGRQSGNGVYIGKPGEKFLHRILFPVRVYGGSIISLARAEAFALPQSTDDPSPGSIEYKLFTLKPGKAIVIGRNHFPSRTSEVSQYHVTIVRLQDAVLPTGEAERCYRVIDGIIPKDDAPYVDIEFDDWFEAVDWTVIHAGRRVRLGKDGPVLRVPLWKRVPSSEELYFHTFQTHFTHPSLPFPVPSEIFHTLSPERLRRVERLQRHLRPGLSLLREQEWRDASLHFQNLNSVRSEEDDFRDLEKDIALHIGMNTGAQAKETRELVELIAESWCFEYQQTLGSLISRKACLIPLDGPAREIDCALFFRENGIALSQEYLSAFHRDIALSLLYASREIPAVKRQALQLFESLRDLNSGETLTICSHTSSRHDQFQINTQSFPPLIANDLENYSIEFTLEESGIYSISVPQDNGLAPVYRPSSSGTWAQLIGTSHIAPGTPIRIGKFFEYVIP